MLGATGAACAERPVPAVGLDVPTRARSTRPEKWASTVEASIMMASTAYAYEDWITEALCRQLLRKVPRNERVDIPDHGLAVALSPLPLSADHDHDHRGGWALRLTAWRWRA